MSKEVESDKTQLEINALQCEIDWKLIRGVDIIPPNTHRPLSGRLEENVSVVLNSPLSTYDKGDWLD
jgi:hypothetical protein